VSADGSKVFIAISRSNTVWVVNAATNTVVSKIPVGTNPIGVAVTTDGTEVYVVNHSDANSVSVINTATNMVTATVSVGILPVAFPGIFIQPPRITSPPPRFAGKPGRANCRGKSVSALAKQYGGLDAAAAVLGYSSVQALQNAIATYCAMAIGH
jgi:YVTN family beta-propeller protein